MTWIWFLALAITGSGVSNLHSQTTPRFLVTVREVKTTSSPDNDLPGFKHDIFFVKFEATLRNTSDHAIFVSAEPLIPGVPDILLPSGEWKPMMLSSSQYETGNQKYLPCTKVKRGKAFTFSNVSDFIVLARDRPADHTANVRFHFYNVCMVESAGRSTDFVTEGVQINH